MGLKRARAVARLAHRAELEQVEGASVAAHPALAEQHGAGRVQLDRGRDREQHRRECDQRHEREQPVEGVLDRELPPARVGRLQRHDRQAADVVQRRSVVDGLEQARHERHLDAQILALLDGLEQMMVWL